MSLVREQDNVTDTKYVVRNGVGEVLLPGSFYVIRASDVFASAGLWAYVHSVTTVLELDADVHFLSSDQREHLQGVVDQAAELARRWQEAGLGRIPD